MKIDLAHVEKRFGSFVALDNIDLQIASGELVALLGPSGSGKTTLLRIIAGLEWPDRGEVRFGGQNALDRSVGERNVGFVFQNYALFRHMSVAENIAFGLRARPRSTRPSAAKIRARVSELLDLVQLDGLERRYPTQLSGGQRQRVALARALAIEPSVLLLDEPFGALDAKVRKELRRWLRQLHREIQVTSVFVTHDQQEALEVADRVVVLDKGRIEQVGSPQQVYEQPASAFVHDFIGESSSIPILVKEGHARFGGVVLDVKTQGIPDGPARVYFRPHETDIVNGDDAGLTGIVRNISGLGPSRRMEIEINAGPKGQHIEIETVRSGDVSVGSRVGINIRSCRVYSLAS